MSIHFVKAAFDAASRTPEAMRHYAGADFFNADAAMTPDVRKLIASRARNEVCNNGYVSGIVRTLANDAIGTGPRLQLECNVDDNDAMRKIERRWNDWAEEIDLAGKLNVARISKATDGEVFFIIGSNPAIRTIPVDVTLYESEQIGSGIEMTLPEYYDNGIPKEVDGVLFDRYGNPTGYRVFFFHPGGTVNFSFANSRVIAADKVLHYKNVIRPGQHRGISELTPTLNLFNDIRRYSQAVLSAAETAAEISFLLYTNTIPDGDESEENPKFMDTMVFNKNTGLALPEGYQASQLKAEQPTSTYDQYVDAKLCEAARPFSMPFNVAKGNSSSYNYASGRLDHQTYHRQIKDERKMIERVILNRLFRVFSLQDQARHQEDYQKHHQFSAAWFWDGYAHVDPVKESNAQKIRLNESGVSSLAEECAIEGKDWRDVIRQKVKEEKFLQDARSAAGLPDKTLQPTQNSQQSTQEEEENGE